MQLLETIKCKNGKLYNMGFHQARFDFARKKNYTNCSFIDLFKEICIPKEFQNGLFRCRVLYTNKIEKIEFLPHTIKEVNSLKLIQDNNIDYSFKFSDRKALKRLHEQRGNCDDILIVKHGNITDSFTANPIFYDGKTWWTSNTPLLKGTQRAYLLASKQIEQCTITLQDLPRFKKVGLINALQSFEDMPVIDMDAVIF